MRARLSELERAGLTLAWEPCGDWPDHPDRVREVCRDLELVHVVDPIRTDPVHDQDVCCASGPRRATLATLSEGRFRLGPTNFPRS
jgi:hypothetical protein